MKNLLTIAFLTIIINSAMSQTAVNFTCNDCIGNSYDLFTQLDAGKVIVLCWVMPCGACLGPSLTTYNVVQSYQSSNPDKVVMYLVDDYANTTCASIDSWANSNKITNTIRFSNSAINMLDYGETGMPKIVVLAGANHDVLYNVTSSVNITDLQNAIDQGILLSTEIIEKNEVNSEISLSPNPAQNYSTLKIDIEKSSNVDITIYNSTGIKVMNLFNNILSNGEHNIMINTECLSFGIYFISINSDKLNEVIKLIVNK